MSRRSARQDGRRRCPRSSALPSFVGSIFSGLRVPYVLHAEPQAVQDPQRVREAGVIRRARLRNNDKVRHGEAEEQRTEACLFHVPQVSSVLLEKWGGAAG